MKKFDEEILGSLKDLTELYILVKEIILFGEEADPDKKTDLQPINELRNGFDHLMRVFASYFEVEREYDKIYVKRNLEKAFGHVYRAG